MDLLGPIVQVLLCLWGPISRQFCYIKDLNYNMATLNQETERLKSKHEAVKAQVDDAVSAGKTQLPPVQTWLAAADRAVVDVGSIRLEIEQGRSRCCCVDLNSRRRLGKRVIRKINDVEKLSGEGDFDRVAQSPRRSQMPDRKQVPEEIQRQSTAKETLEEILECLNNEECGVISVWGMGGIGKTTLVKEIYNKFNASTDFQQVIWVTISKDLNLEVVQQKIGNKLDVEFHGNEGIEEKRDRLYARLRNLRYMLILDDLWQKFSLDQVGIPQPDRQNQCKIVITTRSKYLSNVMEADRQIKVRTLASDEAWNLFWGKTGDVILSPEIKPLAENVVAECGGLPLAIITVGGAMRNKAKKELWEDALRALRAPAVPEVPGMEREVFLPLKLSYDNLEDPKIQLFFLYCSLYPEDYDIHVEQHLLRYWAFEKGLIDNVDSLDQAFKKGYGIIERLKDACLLEEGSGGDRYVRMHDLLRDLAIWITSPSSSCSQASKFLVKAGKEPQEPPEEKMWEGIQRISLSMTSQSSQITERMTPTCPDLVSLFLSGAINGPPFTIHDGFFQIMPKLQVLVLSYTVIKSLPPSLSQLVNLRVLDASGCGSLQDVPPLGHLKELQLLDLWGTDIESLPQGIASLAKLRSLDLSETKALATIPGDIISGLTSLEDLGLYSLEQMMSMEIWREVATLRRLTSLRIALLSLDAFSADDMKHPMWSRLSRFQIQFGHPGTSFNRDYRERTLLISHCEELPSLHKAFGGLPTGFQQLRSISISGCHKLRCIFSFGMLQHLQSLESLSVSNCQEIVEIVEGGPLPDTALQRLSYMDLMVLPKLKSISISACEIFISDCHKLRCIFSSSTLQHLHSLESLSVYNCEEIVEIVEGGLLPDATLQRFRLLNLLNLPKLKGISISACQICISGCHKLSCIFSSSMLQHLHPLESLSVSDCEEIVEIVEGGPLPDTALPRLRELGLQKLAKLKSISISASYIIISGCLKLRCIFSSNMFQHLHRIQLLKVEDCEEIVEIVEGGPLSDTALQRLSVLNLQNLPKLKSISISACQIWIRDCPKLRCIFSSRMLQHLHPLERLLVYNCEEMVEIVEGGALPDTALQSLMELNLHKLPKLTAICSQQLVLTSIKRIWMEDCPELKKLPVLCSGIQEIGRVICASREWWEGIEWEDEHSKSLYSTIYIERQGDDV